MSVQPCACLVLVEDRKGEASLKNKTNNNNKNFFMLICNWFEKKGFQ